MKLAAVVGATRGIGLASAHRLASDGFKLLLLGRNTELLNNVARQISDINNVLLPDCIPIDSSDPKLVKDAFQWIYKAHAGLDVLVYNAGIFEASPIGMVSSEQIRRVFSTNVDGVLYCSQYAARLMGKRGGGSIINVSSIMGTNGAAGQAVYSASKAAVIGITKSLAKELAPSNIRVNAVAPGFIDTDMSRSASTDVFKERLASIKMGRIGKPEEVANVISFLASDDASYITGQTIGVDGGMLI